MMSDALNECVCPPPLPVIVNEYVPGIACRFVVTVSSDVNGGVPWFLLADRKMPWAKVVGKAMVTA